MPTSCINFLFALLISRPFNSPDAILFMQHAAPFGYLLYHLPGLLSSFFSSALAPSPTIFLNSNSLVNSRLRMLRSLTRSLQHCIRAARGVRVPSVCTRSINWLTRRRVLAQDVKHEDGFVWDSLYLTRGWGTL